MRECRATVLLAATGEDEAQALALLREAGLEVVCAGTDEALDRVASRSIDVLVASAPVCARLVELVAEALRRDPAVQIVIATVRADFDDALACLRAGASDVIAMPIERDALLSSVGRALERRRARGLAHELLGAVRSTGLGQLAGSIAHEIANPIAILTSSLEAASESLGALAGLAPLVAQAGGQVHAWWEGTGRPSLEQANEVIAEAQEGAERLKLLARDVRGMVRADPSALSDFALREALESALRVGRAELTAHVKLAIDVPPRLGVRANRGALTQALLHVFVRVAQAAHDAGARRANVHVRAQERGETVAIEVEDDVAPAEAIPAARHLAPYLPAGAPAGSGALGIAVARDLVERQGGSLTARSAQSGGTVFELRLPAAAHAGRAASP